MYSTVDDCGELESFSFWRKKKMIPYMKSCGIFLNSGKYLFRYSPCGSSLLASATGHVHFEESSNFSNADDEIHIQFPAQTLQSASSRCFRKNCSPSSQLYHRAPRVRNVATAFLSVWCSHPSAISCRIAASISGNPV